MASQDKGCTHEKNNEGDPLKLSECGNKRPSSTHQNQAPEKPPVAAKPKRKPPSPPTKPVTSPPRSAPSRQSSQISLSSSTSSTSINQSNDQCHENHQQENHDPSISANEQIPSELPDKVPPQKSSQAPPLPLSPPSKVRLCRSLSGSKTSQNKTDPISPNTTISSPPITSPSLSSSSSATSFLSPSSSLNLISESSTPLSRGKSPPPVRPKPVPSIKPSPSQSIGNHSTSPNPPPRKTIKDQRTNVSVSKSENPDCSVSDHASPNSSQPVPRRKAAPPPPRVPNKSPKHVPKSTPNKSSRSPPPRPMSPPTKSLSPVSPSNTPVSHVTNSETAPSQTSADPAFPLGPSQSQPLTSNPHPSQTPTPETVSVENLAKPSDGEELKQRIPASTKEPENKRVPPPLPKNPPRGRTRTLRKSKSVTATPQSPPPPPPPRLIPPKLSCLRSKSLQADSVLTAGVDHLDSVPSDASIVVDSNLRSNSASDVDVKTAKPVDEADNRDVTDKSVDNIVPTQNVGEVDSCVTDKVDSCVTDEVNSCVTEEKVNSKDVCLVTEITESDLSTQTEKLISQTETLPIQTEKLSAQTEDKRDALVTRRALPRPVPRKRLSINSVEVPKEQLTVSPQADHLTKANTSIENEEQYSEVYTGGSSDNSTSGSFPLVSCQEPNIYQKVNEDDSLSSPSEDSEQKIVSDLSSDNPPISPHSSNDNDELSLPTDEPEATCDMLKEIEELLKNKLGNLDDPTLTSLSNEDVSLKTCNDNKDNEVEPVRPPRPKRKASLCKGSLESLNSIDTSSNECLPSSAPDLGSDQITKSAPPKPKRTTLPRVSRSRSDVTGTKSLFKGFDDSSISSSALNLPSEEIKPALPPRIESLRKGYASPSQLQTTTPPPLPPRNKPRSASMNAAEGTGKDRSHSSPVLVGSPSQEPPPKPALGVMPTDNKPRGITLNPKIDDMSAFTKGALPASAGQGQSRPAPRPVRKAPPPPAHTKRNATFGPGDHKSTTSTPDSRKPQTDTTKDQPSREATPTRSMPGMKVKKSKSLFHKWTSKKEEDVEYYDISETMKSEPSPVSNNVKKHEGSPKPDNSFTKDTKSPPKLPPRPKVLTGSPRIPHNEKDNTDTPLDGNPNPKDSTDVNTTPQSSPEREQSLREKRAQTALIQKVSQDIGFNLASSSTDSALDESAIETKKGDNHDEAIDVINESERVMKDGEFFIETLAEIESKKNTMSPLTPTPRDRRVSSVSNYSTASEQDEEGDAPMEDVSSHSDTDPEDAEAIYAERKAKKVFNIAQEIASSERTFVDVLKLLNVDFRLHISKETEKQGQPVIPSETLNKILDFLPQLQNFNEDLLKDLEHRVENWVDNPCISDIFVKKGPFLKLYSSYIRNFENSTAILDDSCKKNLMFASAVKDFEMGSRCAKLALKHFMLKPIQRIPQYKLLLQEYQKNLHPHSKDYKDTMTALNIVTEVADHANESMRHGDNVQKLLEIQRSLIGQFEVIQPGREFMKQGELQKVSRKVLQPRMFFLFSDVLLYTTPVTSGFKLNNILPLAGMKVDIPKNEVYEFEFNIISVQRSFTLCASSSQEREVWLEALHRALDDNLKRFNTFESQRAAPQTSLIDKDFVLGHKAPLWVPDARVTMCMLCLSEFTITWRRHHCRSCGRIICHQCSNNTAPLRYLQYKPARVCNECYGKLQDVVFEECQNPNSKTRRKSSFRGTDDSKPTSPTSLTADAKGDTVDSVESGLSLNGLLSRFHRIRKSGIGGDKKNYRPSVLKEVHANDEGSDMSGYLRILKNRKWKKLWFVVKGNVLYTYKASEDMAAIESMPLLGYEVTRMNCWYEGAEPDLLFELSHQNTQRLVSKPGRDSVSPRQLPDLEKTKQRLVFRTDSATAVTKWLDVLRAASCT